MSADRTGFPEPIFIGGSARSGTHAMGRLVAAHPRYHLIGTEARLHSFKEGLPDLLAGRTELERFLELCRGHWWKRGFRQRQGLRRVSGRGRRERALAEFEASFEADPWEAGRRLVRALLDPAAQQAGKPAWAEVTGYNVLNAPTLLGLFPNAKIINMVRDGRAVVAAHLKKESLTDDPKVALAHWQRRIRTADAAIRQLPPAAVLTVHLEDLVALDRERSFARLVEFLEVDDPAPMRAYFDSGISADAANLGRWRERMPPPDARRIDRRYRRIVRELEHEGIEWAPKPEPRRFGGLLGR